MRTKRTFLFSHAETAVGKRRIGRTSRHFSWPMGFDRLLKIGKLGVDEGYRAAGFFHGSKSFPSASMTILTRSTADSALIFR